MTSAATPAPTWWSLSPLVLGTFVIAIEGTVLTGVLPLLSKDLQASPGSIGQTLAVYPLTFAIGAPLLALLTGGHSQRAASALGLVLFATGNLVSATAPTLPLLAAGRLIAACGACLFLPNAAARAATLGTERRGRAMSIVGSGHTAASLAGAPLGVYAASHIGWRTILLLLACTATIAAILQYQGRLGHDQASTMPLRERLRFLRDRQLLSILLLSTAVVAGEFLVYAYIAVIATDSTGAPQEAVTVVIMTLGLGSTIGTLLGGFLVDRIGWPRVLKTSIIMIGCALLPLPIAHNLVLFCACLALWGIFGWTFTPAQANRLIATFPQNNALLLTLNTSAVQTGIATGGIVGGVVLRTGGPALLPVSGAALMVVVFLLHWRTSRRK